MTSIAVLIASTSNNSGWKSADDVSFISCTIPSVVSLASDDFRYKFFIGYDHDDQFFLDSHSELEKILEAMSIDFDLIAIDNPAHKPCPVWNSLFKVAYDEGFDYFFQAGDDVKLFNRFDIDFTSYLESLDNVGVIGPLSEHCPPVITQAFFHRKHMNVFGFLYPPELPDWNSDTWLTSIYKQFKRSKVSGLHEVKNTRVANHGKSNRYEISSDNEEKLHKCLNLYAPVLEKYIKKEVFHKTPKKKLLINQPGRHGDIIICLPIARHYSVSFDVFWLCPDEYHPMFSYVDYCTPVSKDSGGYDFIIDLSFGFGGPPEKWWQETIHTWDSFVTAKYYLADVPLEEKWNLHWNRDKQKEDSLYNLVVGEEKYIVVHDSGSSGSFPISIDSKLDVIVFSPIENYTVFDWYKVLMNAEEIHCVDSLLLNFVDSCIYGPKKIFHDVRNSDKVLNALMKKDEWEVMS